MRNTIVYKAIIIMSVLISINAFSQTQNIRNKKLLFANRNGVNFPSIGYNPTIAQFGGGPTTWDPSTTATLANGVEGLNHIEDAAGNIIAYISTTDVGLNGGGTFYDKNLNKMPSDNLKLNLGTKAEISVCPNPANPNQWYVFYAWESGVGSGQMHEFHYTIIDFSLNSGNGDVISYNTLIPSNDVCEAIEVIEKASITGASTNTYWLLSHERGQGLTRWFIGATGLVPASKTTLFSFNTNGLNQNPEGELEYTNGKLGWVDRYNNDIYFGNFDNVTGTYTHISTMDLISTVPGSNTKTLYGLEFSPDATKLYLTFEIAGSTVIYQFDLNSAAPFYSPVLVGGPYGLNPWGDQIIESSLELAYDGKIYANLYRNVNVEIINDPNLAGVACNVTAQNVGNWARAGGISDPVQYATPLNVLPITLMNFDAFNLNSNSNKIEWETASEINNDFFTVERSSNMSDWEIVEIVSGAGNSNKVNSYYVPDYNPYQLTYYRLKQTDYDGKFTYSRVTTVNNTKGLNDISIYPNPTTGEVNIEWDLPLNTIEIFDARSKLIFSSDGNTKLNISDLPQGVYILKAYSSEENRTVRIVKK